jgi:uncharacterized protein (DUF433 family)
MSRLRQAFLTVPEAAFIAGVSPRMVQREIDERIVEACTRDGRRSVSGIDLLYLYVIRGLHNQMTPKLRRQVRDAIASSAARNETTARIEPFIICLASLEEDLLASLKTLENAKHDFIEVRADVIAGEPVIRGTRLSARFVAQLVREGVGTEELKEEYDLTAEQVQAAVLFDRVTPKRGRPRDRAGYR